MEAALLASLQNSTTEHEQRLIALEELLKQLVQQSNADSSSGETAVNGLRQQLNQLSEQLAVLDGRLALLEPSLKELSNRVSEFQAQSQVMVENYGNAAKAFNAMKGQYLKLASETGRLQQALRRLGDIP
jgi:chromosome segregation ATPase